MYNRSFGVIGRGAVGMGGLCAALKTEVQKARDQITDLRLNQEVSFFHHLFSLSGLHLCGASLSHLVCLDSELPSKEERCIRAESSNHTDSC